MARRFDRHEATSTARIERAQSQAEESVAAAAQPESGAVADLESYGVSESELSDLHIVTGEEELPGDTTAHVIVVADNAVDALAEVFNARDLDGVMELCGADCEVPGLASDVTDVGPALDDLWVRRPTVTMTRMVVDGVAVGVLWERLGSDSWVTVGTVHLDMAGDEIEVLEFSEAVDMLDRRNPAPPELDDPFWEDPDEMLPD